MAGVSLSTRLIVLLLLLYFSFVLSITCAGCAAQFLNAKALSNHLRRDLFGCKKLSSAGGKRPRPDEDATGVRAEGAGGGPQQPGGAEGGGGGMEEGGGTAAARRGRGAAAWRRGGGAAVATAAPATAATA